jgi:glycosyltransferase involved in cell wall biosynthesis
VSNIFINGLNSKTGGGKSILNNYLSLLNSKNQLKNRFFVLSPQKEEYERYSSERINIIDIKQLYKNNILFPFVNHYVLPKILKNLKIDVIFNMSDIVIPTDIPQVYLFDWPYAAYPKSVVWGRMDWKSYIQRKIKLYFFKKYISDATVVIAQTKTMKDKLLSLYGLNNIKIVPNAVSLENLTGGQSFDFNLPTNRFKLLYLTYYYSHKNIEIFLPLARKIKDMDLPYSLITTISAGQHKKAKQFLDIVKKENLEDIIINLGPIQMSHVPSLYAQTDALLIPTLLESFSGTYVEAMFHEKVILTSNLDFAIDVCGDSAIYFDPMDSDAILSSIMRASTDVPMRKEKIEKGKGMLARMLTWEQAFSKYQELLKSVNNKLH